MGVPWCNGCAHEGKGAFCDPCGKCCMGNEFVKKEEKKVVVMSGFENRFWPVCDALRVFARENRLIMYWYTDNQLGKPLPPFNRRFKFKAVGGGECNVTVNFTDITSIAGTIQAIKNHVRMKLIGGWKPKWAMVDDIHVKYHPKPIHLDKEQFIINNYFNNLINDILGTNKEVNMNTVYRKLAIMDVIFNGPATIVIWSDNTKTVVKAQDGEKIDYEKGLAMAISKKFLGNKGNYYNTFEKYLKNAPVVKKTTKRTSKKVEITDEEIQAQSDALFADFDKKVKVTTKEMVDDFIKEALPEAEGKILKATKIPDKNEVIIVLTSGTKFRYSYNSKLASVID